MSGKAPKIEPNPPAAEVRAAQEQCRGLLAEADARLERGGAVAFPWAVRKTAAGLGCSVVEALLLWHHADLHFARVDTDPADPRRFVLAPNAQGTPGQGRPAALMPLWLDDAGQTPWTVEVGGLLHLWLCGGPVDILALDLTSRRFWRLTRRAADLALGDVFEGRDMLRLRGDAHRLLADLGGHLRLKAEAGGRHPVAPPVGLLVLDPAAFDWTKKGYLHGVEAIDILDQPAGGPLGRALQKLNPRIGGPQGVALTGVPADAFKRRAAA